MDRYSQLVRMPGRGRTRQARRAAAAGRARARPGEFNEAACCSAAPGAWPRAAASVLADMGADFATALDDPVRALVAEAGLDAAVFNPLGARRPALQGADLRRHRDHQLRPARGAAALLYPTIRRVLPSGRVIVLGGGRRALEGFTRSLGKEVGAARPSTSCRSRTAPRSGSQAHCASCSSRARRTCPGRWLRVGPGRDVPLTGRAARVTGASRGIGAAIADGARARGRNRRAARPARRRASARHHRRDAPERSWPSTSPKGSTSSSTTRA